MKWPPKAEREVWEIENFLATYRQLPHGYNLAVSERRERPDFFVEEVGGGRRFGVELTSVYLHDRSVPDMHQNNGYDWLNPPCNEKELVQSEERLVEAIKSKVMTARSNYDLRYPLLLSVYVNEYIAVHFDRERWHGLHARNLGTFEDIAPFAEVVFWNLPNQGVFSVPAPSESA